MTPKTNEMSKGRVIKSEVIFATKVVFLQNGGKGNSNYNIYSEVLKVVARNLKNHSPLHFSLTKYTAHKKFLMISLITLNNNSKRDKFIELLWIQNNKSRILYTLICRFEYNTH